MNLLMKILGSDEQSVQEELAKLEAEESAFEPSLGVSADDAHAHVDGLVASARAYFVEQFADLRSVPDDPIRQDAGRYDRRSRAEIDATKAAFARKREGLKQALTAKQEAVGEAESKARREVAEARAADLLGK